MKSILEIIMTIVLNLSCIALIITVLLQEGQEPGEALTGTVKKDSYWGAHRGSSMEGILKKLTVILGVLIFAIAIVLVIM